MNIVIKFPQSKNVATEQNEPGKKNVDLENVDLEQGKPVVILGANGSGKTRLSYKVEELNDKRVSTCSVADNAMLVHRISAQKSLSISESIQLMDYDSSQRALLYGDANKHSTKLGNRYTVH